MPKAKTAEVADASAKPPKKNSIVLALLQREQGATLAELQSAIGWQPHTTRAALTAVRKKHELEKRKRDDLTCYHLTSTS